LADFLYLGVKLIKELSHSLLNIDPAIRSNLIWVII